MEIVPVLSAAVAVISAAASGFTFWINRGKAEAQAANAETCAIAANAKADLIATHLAEYKAEVARSYVTIASIDKVEQRLTLEVHRLSDELGRRIDEMTKMVVEALAQQRGGGKRTP